MGVCPGVGKGVAPGVRNSALRVSASCLLRLLPGTRPCICNAEFRATPINNFSAFKSKMILYHLYRTQCLVNSYNGMTVIYEDEDHVAHIECPTY